MRFFRALFPLLVTAALVLTLDHNWGPIPALGRLLDPVNGWGANAEPVAQSFDARLSFKELRQPADIFIEDRLVPHIRAANDHDLYFLQGYVHASFRLWQMDMQTRAAAGRVGEVAGEKWGTDKKTGEYKNLILAFDRAQRRKGMVYAARNSLSAVVSDPRSRTMLDAYTQGVNAYIRKCSYRNYPVEYKLLGYPPEPWTNLKTALLMKYMADDLTGYTEDFQLTMLRDALPAETFEYLFPGRLKGSIPVVPEGTKFGPPSMPVPPAPDAVIWTHFGVTAVSANRHSQIYQEPAAAAGIGSNNWVIGGAHTASGAPILCNDPHLGLNLPSLWFEMQLTTPQLNVYGVSLPGAPGIVIGFNDSISWGMTNNYRDVKDYYEIEAIDKDRYRFDGQPRAFTRSVELIKIKGKPDVRDTVLYTLHGPVEYDETCPDPARSGKKIALCWMAHRPTNELLSLYLLNRAGNYLQFTGALQHFECPAQNFVYADRAGNIALWGQGRFINKWKDQGRYVMKGNTSATLWGKDIPMDENPHVLNPPQGYLASANQMTTDSTYPYWYNGYFYDFRAWTLNGLIRKDFFQESPDMASPSAETPKNFTPDFPRQSLSMGSEVTIDPIELSGGIQNSVFSILNYNLSTVIHKNSGDDLTWKSEQATRTQIFWSQLYKNIWQDEFGNFPLPLYPSEERTLQLLLTDPACSFYDDKRTAQKETLADMIDRSLRETNDSLNKLKAGLGSLEWYKVKNTTLTHLLKLPAFSYTGLKIGGWGNTINAAKTSHGPSWRMIVEMGKDSIRAYGVYPGGQSGNPGSRYYGTFVDKWAAGQYYRLVFLSRGQAPSPSLVKYTWHIQPGK